MDEEQINTTGPNIEVVMNLKSSGDCVPFSVTRKTTCFKNSGIVVRPLAYYFSVCCKINGEEITKTYALAYQGNRPIIELAYCDFCTSCELCQFRQICELHRRQIRALFYEEKTMEEK